MGVFLLVVASIFSALAAQAITWDFNEEGNAQGWVAQEGVSSLSTEFPLLHAEAHDGSWRIQVHPFEAGRNPAINLISPIIGHDSALFDRMTIRFRVVHTRPLTGWFGLSWTNPTNKKVPGGELREYCEDLGKENPGVPCYSRFGITADKLVYNTDWQEVVISDLRSRPALAPNGDPYEILWEGELIDIRLYMSLFDLNRNSDEPYRVQGPDEVPEAVEIDWIRLTGVEEQLQGELPPPPALTSAMFGNLFSAPVFYPLGISNFYNVRVMGDLDDDGDVDVMGGWQGGGAAGKASWTMARNDGKGHFTPAELSLPVPPQATNIRAADLDGNGRLDLVYFRRVQSSSSPRRVQILLNDAERGWVPGQEIKGLFFAYLRDVDNDGDQDLWMDGQDDTEGYWRPTEDNMRRVLFNDGKANFSSPRIFEPPTPDFSLGAVAYPVRPDRAMSMIWSPLTTGNGTELANPAALYASTYPDAEGNIVKEPLDIGAGYGRLYSVGDFDLDGDVDVVASEASVVGELEDPWVSFGLNFLSNRGDGRLDTLASFKEPRYSPLFGSNTFDVSGDGLVDVVVVHTDIRNPGVLVIVQQPDGHFVQEGRYPLEGGKGGAVMDGDVDGDGDKDLVVIDERYAGGGIHILLNQTSERSTAVEERVAVGPLQYHLGTAYPNPFNPGVVIPFTLGPSSLPVSLTIYNTLGQEVRRLELGELPAGAHQAAWDGLDERGRELSSGAYLYLLQAGAWSASGKMVKNQ